MIGAIAGDTIGSVYEFHNTKDYDFPLFQDKSIYTDDSVMTLAIAYWLLTDKEHTYQKLEDALVLFGKNCPCPMGGYGGSFAKWLFHPKDLYPYDGKYGASPYESMTARHPYGSFGNGSAMRVGAVGWFFDTLEETERVAKITAEITHNHPEGIKGAQATAAAIFLARTGKTKDEIRDYIEQTYGYDLHKTWEDWHYAYHWEDSCQGTVPQAIIAFLDSRNFEDAIRKAVSMGGDSDTLACITGGIAEAYYGGVPQEIAQRVTHNLPSVFSRIIDAMKQKTAYGSPIEITSSNYTNYIGLPIAAYSIASGGAMGEVCGVVIITREGKRYHTNYGGQISEEELSHIIPGEKEGWHKEYLGFGNLLFVRESLWENVDKEAQALINKRKEEGRSDLLYNVWQEAVRKVCANSGG
jgi:ADP-ribosylglycohydrolase